MGIDSQELFNVILVVSTGHIFKHGMFRQLLLHLIFHRNLRSTLALKVDAQAVVRLLLMDRPERAACSSQVGWLRPVNGRLLLLTQLVTSAFEPVWLLRDFGRGVHVNIFSVVGVEAAHYALDFHERALVHLPRAAAFDCKCGLVSQTFAESAPGRSFAGALRQQSVR